MIKEDLTYPIELHPSCNIVDSTKLNSFMTCPRMYFYEHVLGWNIPSNHLVFGKAWHEAMEHLLLTSYEKEDLIVAYQKFITEYSKVYAPDEYEDFPPKTPKRAMYALIAYTEHWKYDRSEFELLELDGKPLTEIAGNVVLSDEFSLYFRMDAICKGARGIFPLEHKTGSSSYMWAEQWDLAMQVYTYLYVMYCMFDAQYVEGVRLNGTILKKTKDSKTRDDKAGIDRHFEFLRPTVYRTPEQIEAWMERTIYHMSMMRYNYDLLAKDTVDAKIMRAFPMVTTSCTKYMGCDYKTFCMSIDNPLKHAIHGTPIGWDKKHWDPTAGEIRDIGTLKLK